MPEDRALGVNTNEPWPTLSRTCKSQDIAHASEK
jgi:hypothetical protein